MSDQKFPLGWVSHVIVAAIQTYYPRLHLSRAADPGASNFPQSSGICAVRTQLCLWAQWGHSNWWDKYVCRTADSLCSQDPFAHYDHWTPIKWSFFTKILTWQANLNHKHPHPSYFGGKLFVVLKLVGELCWGYRFNLKHFKSNVFCLDYNIKPIQFLTAFWISLRSCT